MLRQCVGVEALTEEEEEDEGFWRSTGGGGDDGAWLAAGAVVLTVRRSAAGWGPGGGGGGALVVGGICRGRRAAAAGGGIPLGLLLSPRSPVGAPPASLSVAVCPPPPSLHMTSQKTTPRWLYSPSFVLFQRRDTRQIMLNGRRWLPEEWLLCRQCQV